MDIESTEKDSRHIQYGSESYKKLLSEIENDTKSNRFHLILLVGESKKKKQDTLDEIEKHTARNFKQTDANELISPNETKTRERLDELFDNYSSQDAMLYITNGANLCGAFTGYTLSRVKYATPQERYFLKKIQAVSGLIIIDFKDANEVDRTLCRAANSLVTFELSNSFFKRFIWNLKNISVQGSNLSTKRPTHKGETAGNF